MHPLEWTVLASDRVRFAGEPVVAVVATSPGDRGGRARARRARPGDAAGGRRSGARPGRPTPRSSIRSGAPTSSSTWRPPAPGLADAIAAAPHVLARAVREPPHHGAADGDPRRAGGVRRRHRSPDHDRLDAAAPPAAHGRGRGVRHDRGVGAGDRARHGWRIRQQAALPPRGVPRGDARTHHRRAGAVGRGPQRSAHRVGALASAGARRHRRVRRRRHGCSRSRVDVTSDVGNPVLVLLRHRSVVGDGRRAVRCVRRCPSTAGRSRAWRRPPARSAPTAASVNPRRT